MKYLILFLLVPLTSFSQNKGASPITNSQQLTAAKNTYAVVVGISDYQDEGIPDLRFADRDAEAFANYLRSPAGGSLDNDHLQILTNVNATMANFAAALDRLLDVSREGDEAIIYFSGHGDVERKTISQPGYLLCWDAPSRVYMAGGAFNLRDLQEVVATLSLQKKVKVVVVTDACHAGKLAGANIGGAQATTANLARQFANEVKILSCQPNEFSLEGEQWGGGRGVFSYHLVDGLYGLADRNADGAVSVFEIGRYLEDRVSTEAAPQNQMPMVVGDKSGQLARVNAAVLENLKKTKNSLPTSFAATESRGSEDEILAKLDSSLRKKYLDFKTALAEKHFLPSPENSKLSADELYTALLAEPTFTPLHGMMKRNFAAALQNDAQQVVNSFLKSDPGMFLTRQSYFTKFQPYARYLERAAELLGPEHYMYAALQARKAFFEGFLMVESSRNPDVEHGARALQKFHEALRWQPEMPLAFWKMSEVFGYNFRQADSAEIYAQRACTLQPGWLLPLETMCFLMTEKFQNMGKAKHYLDQIHQIDSNSVFLQANLGLYYYRSGQPSAAEYHLRRAIQLAPTLTGSHVNLGLLYLDQGRYVEAEALFKEVLRIHPDNEWAMRNLGVAHFARRHYAEAEALYQKSIEIDPTFVETHIRFGELYFATNRFAEAEKSFLTAVRLDSFFPWSWYYLGNFYLTTGRPEAAQSTIEMALLVDSTQALTWDFLAHLFTRKNQFDRAENCLQKSFTLDSLLSGNSNEMAFLRFRQGKNREAEQWCYRTLNRYPSDWEAMKYLALLAYRNGCRAGAFEWLEKSIRNGATLTVLLEFPDLEPLRRRKEWKALMKKYFPDKIKN